MEIVTILLTATLQRATLQREKKKREANASLYCND